MSQVGQPANFNKFSPLADSLGFRRTPGTAPILARAKVKIPLQILSDLRSFIWLLKLENSQNCLPIAICRRIARLAAKDKEMAGR